VISASPAVRPPPSRAKARDAEPFQWSLSVDFGEADGLELEGRIACTLAQLQTLGVKQVRYELTQNLTRDIATNPDNRELRIVRALTQAGVDVLAVVGVGTRRALEPGLDADAPDYLERVTGNVRDVVRALTPLGVTRYQLENEVNAAGLATLPGYQWRDGRRWWDDDFKEEVLSALSQTVKQSNPDALVHTNLLDGLSDPSGSVDEMLERFTPYLDEIGFDFYSNQVLPYALTEHVPGRLGRLFRGMLGTDDIAALLKERVAHYEEVTGLPVRIAETGYPTRHAVAGHTAAGQARFVEEVTEAAAESGAIGLGYYRLMDPEAVNPSFIEGLNPNRGTEPFFGLVSADCEPKRGTVSGWAWNDEGAVPRLVRVKRDVSAFDAFREAVAQTKQE
jgi:hypothetical protein